MQIFPEFKKNAIILFISRLYCVNFTHIYTNFPYEFVPLYEQNMALKLHFQLSLDAQCFTQILSFFDILWPCEVNFKGASKRSIFLHKYLCQLSILSSYENYYFCANIWLVRYLYSCEDNIESLCKKLCNLNPRLELKLWIQSVSTN